MKKLRFTFFFNWSIAFLLITIIGFIPSFLLRPMFRETELPTYLILHGIVMLIWFSGYFFQNLLVAQRKVANHRKFGIYWFLLAIVMAFANYYVVMSITKEILSSSPTYYESIRTVENSGGLVVGNLFITIFSSIFILLAYLKRNKPNAHKRAIFGASFLLLTPAFDRFVRPFGLPEIFQFLGSWIIPFSLLGYEIFRRKKVHPMTWLIMAITLLMVPALLAILNNDSIINGLVEFIG